MGRFSKIYEEVMSSVRANDRLISEAYRRGPTIPYKMQDVALAVKNATNGFNGEWEKGRSGAITFRELEQLKSNPPSDADKAEAKKIILATNSFWMNKTGDFADDIKKCLTSFMCNSDKVGLVAYAMWQAMRESKASDMNLSKTFEVGSKVELTLTVDDTFVSTWNRFSFQPHYRNYHDYDNTTVHLLCTCSEYPGVKFDLAVGSKMQRTQLSSFSACPSYRVGGSTESLIKGDKFKVEATVKSVDTTKLTISLNKGDVKEIFEFAKSDAQLKKEAEDAKKSKAEASKNTFDDLVKKLVNKFDALCLGSTVDDSKVKNFEALIKCAPAVANADALVDSIKIILPEAASIEADIRKFYDEVHAME